MKFGIVVTDQGQARIVSDLIAEALDRDWDVHCFLTENGVNLLTNEAVISMLGRDRLHFTVCEFSVERYCKDLDPEICEMVIIGGQYQNAELVHNSDHVLVF